MARTQARVTDRQPLNSQDPVKVWLSKVERVIEARSKWVFIPINASFAPKSRPAGAETVLISLYFILDARGLTRQFMFLHIAKRLPSFAY
jgi:hypothetical protein